MAVKSTGKFTVIGIDPLTAKASGNKFWAVALMPGADNADGPSTATVPPWGSWMVDRLTQALEAGEEIGIELQEWLDRDGQSQKDRDGNPKWNITGIEGLEQPSRGGGGGAGGSARGGGMSRDEEIRSSALLAASQFLGTAKANKSNTLGATVSLFESYIRDGGELPC